MSLILPPLGAPQLMSLSSLAKALEERSIPLRRLDVELAKLAGYKRHEEREGDKSRAFWTSPTGEDGVDLPKFTQSLQKAYELSEILIPDVVCAATWGEGVCKAQILGDPAVSAPTMPLALCIAVIRYLRSSNAA